MESQGSQVILNVWTPTSRASMCKSQQLRRPRGRTDSSRIVAAVSFFHLFSELRTSMCHFIGELSLFSDYICDVLFRICLHMVCNSSKILFSLQEELAILSPDFSLNMWYGSSRLKLSGYLFVTSPEQSCMLLLSHHAF
jgi:hypothetical protein